MQVQHVTNTCADSDAEALHDRHCLWWQGGMLILMQRLCRSATVCWQCILPVDVLCATEF